MDAPKKRIWPIAVALAVITFAVYARVLTFGFVNYDDPQYVTNNPPVKGGLTLGGIGWAFSNRHATNWHPLSWISHMLDVDLWGLSAWGHHLTNNLLHVANTLLLFGFFRRTTGAVYRSAFVAALFALHPLHVESVAWISERKDLLSTFFALLTLHAYARFVELKRNAAGPAANWYVSALGLFALGLLSKPMVVTLPFLLLLLDVWPLGRVPIGNWRAAIGRLILEKVPFFALSIASSLVTLWAQQKTIMSIQALPPPIRLFNAILSYGRYLKKIFLPTKLCVLYPYPAFWALLTIALVLVVLIFITVAFVKRRREHPYLAAGWFWFLGTLVPVIGIVQVGVQAMADRYTYLPSVGIFVIVAWGLNDLFVSRSYDRGILKAGGVAALIACAALTLYQQRFWTDGITLFRRALAVTTNNGIAHYNLGMALLEQKRVDEAGEQFASAAKLASYFPETHNNLANVLVIQGKRKEAIPHYLDALKTDSNHVVAHYNLGLTLAELGRVDEAIPHYERALRGRSDFLMAHRDLGLALAKKKDFEGALSHLRLVTERNPRNAEGHFYVGSVLLDAGKTNEAQKELTRALELNSDLGEQFKKEAFEFQQKNEARLAIERYSAALKLQPEDTPTRRRVAVLLSEQGRSEEALQQFQEIVRSQPADAQAFYDLGLALVMAGKTEDATGAYREAIRLRPDFTAAMNDLAWILATHPNSKVRNGQEAVKLAQRACELSGTNQLRFLGTLDAAFAEMGQFDKAIETARQVQSQAMTRGQTNLAQTAERRLEAYQQKKPFRQTDDPSR